jgi:hypothetical protein
VPIFFINIGLFANVRQLPIDGLGLKMDMFFVREFPQLLLFFLVLILVLVLWRLLIIYETRGYNVQMGWRNDLLVLFLALITIAFGIFLAYFFLSIYTFSSMDQRVAFPSSC